MIDVPVLVWYYYAITLLDTELSDAVGKIELALNSQSSENTQVKSKDSFSTSLLYAVVLLRNI